MTTTETPRPDLRPPGIEADERTTLLAFLDYLRESLLAKLVGLDDEALRTPAVGSGTSLLWLVKHLTAVELNWFVWSYAGPDREQWDDEPVVTAEDTAADLAAAYRAAVAAANEVVRGCADLDGPGARSLRETPAPSMRWILVHMVEETARHVGHADILRELLDGAVGR
ncbi:DinB family protein [Kitasatospora sp. NBC_01287]|uniref:DinB family protein n=1 Tax=Kitasatospora sp. NBC_01287 TaxID=2903573 RepID=UPI00225233E2|nr:DinB family protein [Kitasatospora sp. NBC_01287]MCX4746336.1 DinB family protein [Kitasatospora sp. NBC_01287]